MIWKQFSRIWDLEDIHAGNNLRVLNDIGELRKISKIKADIHNFFKASTCNSVYLVYQHSHIVLCISTPCFCLSVDVFCSSFFKVFKYSDTLSLFQSNWLRIAWWLVMLFFFVLFFVTHFFTCCWFLHWDDKLRFALESFNSWLCISISYFFVPDLNFLFTVRFQDTTNYTCCFLNKYFVLKNCRMPIPDQRETFPKFMFERVHFGFVYLTSAKIAYALH